MDDLIKNLRALARGKHDDFSVVFEACLEISRLREALRMIDEAKNGLERMQEEIDDKYCDSHCVWTDHDKDCVIGKRHA